MLGCSDSNFVLRWLVRVPQLSGVHSLASLYPPVLFCFLLLLAPTVIFVLPSQIWFSGVLATENPSLLNLADGDGKKLISIWDPKIWFAKF